LKFVEFRCGLINREERANIIKLEDLSKNIIPNQDCYRSLFFYSDEILTHVTSTGSVSGYRGKTGLDRIVWDFDNEDLDIAKNNVLTLIDRLVTHYDILKYEIGIFFSGRKGFAVELNTKGIIGFDNVLSENIPILTKKFCTKLADDLESFDRVIYNTNRLYRINGTLHQKTSIVKGNEVRLYKTSISHDQLEVMPIEDIKEYCLELHLPIDVDPISKPEKLSELVGELKNDIDNLTKTLPVFYQSAGMPDDTNAPFGQKVCIWRLSQGTLTEYRDNTLLAIADNDKKMGLPPEVIKGKLLGVLELMDRNNPNKAKLDPITEFDIDRIINNNYDMGCFNPILAKVCSKRCYLAPKVFKNDVTSVTTFLEAYRNSSKFYREYYSNIVPTGINSIDNNMPLFLGTYNLLVGKAGQGKTSLMLNFMRNASHNDVPAIFFSMDMSEEMLVQRCAPIIMRKQDGSARFSGKEFMQAHARGDHKLMRDAEEEFAKLSANVLISSKSRLTVAEIRKEIEAQEARWGKKVKLVIVDYVQLLSSDKEGDYTNATFNAGEIKTLAKEMNLCFLGLSQATGNYNDSNILAKGSRAWEEGASTQLNLWRPFQKTNPEFDWVMSIQMAKNRLGPSEQVDLRWDGPSGICRDMQEGEQIELAALKATMEHD
jgi:KaiC/GvpD/RAD55 family RecA-like ATPase